MYVFILVSAITGCVSISIFTSFVGTPIGTVNSALGLKVCAIIEETTKYKSITKKKKKIEMKYYC